MDTTLDILPKAKLFTINLDDFLAVRTDLVDITKWDDLLVEGFHEISEYIMLTLNIIRGDIILLHDDELDLYRNNGKYIWSGTKLEPLYEEIDEYGSIPPDYKVTQTLFNPRYWSTTISHNYIYWLSEDFLDEIQSTITLIPDIAQYVATYTYNGKTQYVIFDLSNLPPITSNMAFECDELRARYCEDDAEYLYFVDKCVYIHVYVPMY